MARGDIGKRLEEARQRIRPFPPRPADLARALDRSRQTVDNWLKGKNDPPPEVIEALSRELGVSVDYALGREPMTLPRLRSEPSGRLKIYGAGSAGDGNSQTIDEEIIENMPRDFCRDDFGGLVVDGDSMMPFLEPSDVAIFRDWHREKIGHIFAAELPGNRWVIKKLVYEDGQFKLRSLNSKYPDITGEFRLTGYLVGFVRDRGPARTIRLNAHGLMED